MERGKAQSRSANLGVSDRRSPGTVMPPFANSQEINFPPKSLALIITRGGEVGILRRKKSSFSPKSQNYSHLDQTRGATSESPSSSADAWVQQEVSRITICICHGRGTGRIPYHLRREKHVNEDKPCTWVGVDAALFVCRCERSAESTAPYETPGPSYHWK